MKVTPVRLLRREDLPRVLAIEAEANPMPWREGDFLPFVSAVTAVSAADKPSPGSAADPAIPGTSTTLSGSAAAGTGARKQGWVYGDGVVQGFACAVAVADEVELQSLAVDSSARGQGIGTALLEALIEWAADAGFRTLHLEVRAGNRPALGLYRRFGFAQAGVRPGYYHDNGEDALLLTREVGRPGSGARGRSAPAQDC